MSTINYDARINFIDEFIAGLKKMEKEMTIHSDERVVLQKLKEIDESELPDESKIIVKYSICFFADFAKKIMLSIQCKKINGMSDFDLLVNQARRSYVEGDESKRA